MRLHLKAYLSCCFGLIVGLSLTTLLSLTGLLCRFSVHSEYDDAIYTYGRKIPLVEKGITLNGVSFPSCVYGREAEDFQKAIESVIQKLLKLDSSAGTTAEVNVIRQVVLGFVPGKSSTAGGHQSAAGRATGKELARAISRRHRNTTRPPQNRPAHSWQHFGVREQLMAAVVLPAGEPSLERMFTTESSWALDVAQTVYYARESFINEYGHYLHSMPNIGRISESESSPGTPLDALRHLHTDFFLDNYNWFMLAGNGSVYVHGRQLEEMLSYMDPEHVVYMGHPATATDDNGSLITYCAGSSGIILSRAALKSLFSNQEACPELLAQINEKAFTYTWSDYDRGLGQCFEKAMGITCANGEKEADTYFFEDATMKTQVYSFLWASKLLSNALTVSPVVSDDHMMSLHYFFKTLDHARLSKQVGQAEEAAMEACKELPSHYFPSSSALEGKCVLNGEESPRTDPQTCPKSGVVEHIPIPFHPTFRYQVIPWIYFDSKYFYPDEELYPKKRLKVFKAYHIELQDVQAEVLKIVRSHYSSALRLKRIINGFFRHDGNRGNDYIIEAEFIQPSKSSSIAIRVELTRPLAYNYITDVSVLGQPERIHFVVPVSKVGERFDVFLQMYEQLSLVTGENTHLVVAAFSDDVDFNSISTRVETYQTKYPSAKFTILRGDGDFSRAKALDFGMSKLADDDLAFFCDVDMDIERDFLNRCRRNTIQGKQVYYPEVFKYYNMKYVSPYHTIPTKIPIKREFGHWVHYAYGMACMYKSDYTTVGGFSMAFTGWGDEDVDLYERVLQKNLHVFRVPDVGLKHRWHPKLCDKASESEKQYKHCVGSMTEDLADKKELAQYILS